MRKIFCIIFLFFLYFSSTYASDELKIISRAEWGADENIRFRDSPEWIKILKQWQEQGIINKNTVYTKAQIDAQNAAKLKSKQIDDILLSQYGSQFEISKKITTENDRKLLWPIQIAKNIHGIVIHHTSTDYPNSLEGIRAIYKYHTLERAWGDIGYNYLIGKDGEIFEGRAGGDKVVAAHDKYNNIGTIGIAIMGDYSKNPINEKQYNSLKLLTSSLVKKYNIDLTKKTYFHSECIGKNCDIPIITELKAPIIGHRDAGHTDCPGDELYKQIDEIKQSILNLPISKTISNDSRILKAFEKIPDEKLIDILANIEYFLDNNIDANKSKLKTLIINYFKDKNSKKYIVSKTYDNKINIKLSYPNNDNIRIKSGSAIFDINRDGNSISIKGKIYSVLKIPKKDINSILEITSWERFQDWDKEKKYNDNKFRGDLIVYVKNDKLIVVNRLNIEDYLKGLGEVSDNESAEKIKTVIIAARSYATWYVTKARKFPGELFDGTDDPNEFQRYIGYGLEKRSPNINKIVDDTKGQLITYKGDLIKPWYFSNSDGKTLSYYKYCSLKYSDEICLKEAKKYPYLQSVEDIASVGKQKQGHGVGISGAGVKYFALKGWTYQMIIKYYLRGVDIL